MGGTLDSHDLRDIYRSKCIYLEPWKLTRLFWFGVKRPCFGWFFPTKIEVIKGFQVYIHMYTDVHMCFLLFVFLHVHIYLCLCIHIWTPRYLNHCIFGAGESSISADLRTKASHQKPTENLGIPGLDNLKLWLINHPPPITYLPRNSRPYDQGILTIGFP